MEYRLRFKRAVALAKAALADPKLRARYERKALRQHKRAWDVALSGYLKETNIEAGKKER